LDRSVCCIVLTRFNVVFEFFVLGLFLVCVFGYPWWIVSLCGWVFVYIVSSLFSLCLPRLVSLYVCVFYVWFISWVLFVACVGVCCVMFVRVRMFFVARCLIASYWLVSMCCIAFSVSTNSCFRLLFAVVPILYLPPFRSKESSSIVSLICVMLQILGWKVCLFCVLVTSISRL
jgi:hypothetical protein